MKGNSFRIFNLELYVLDSLSDYLDGTVTILEGDCTAEERQLLKILAGKSSFNIQQYFIEHASTEKNILVKAGPVQEKHIQWFRVLRTCVTNMRIQRLT